MKVITPIDKVNEVNILIKCGATELYTGFIEKGDPRLLNARFSAPCNFEDFGSLREAVKEASIHNVPFSLCCNARYNNSSKNYILRLIERAMKINITSFIVTDIGLILELLKYFNGAKLILSTLSGCLNSETIRFYRDLGISSITLDRQLSLDEIGIISKKMQDIEFRVLIFHITCEYINAFCRMHRFIYIKKKSISSLMNITGKPRTECKSLYKAIGYKRNLPIEIIKNFSISKCDLSCGACAIPILEQMSIYGVKIVGRGFNTKKKAEAVAFISNVIKLLSNTRLSASEYRQKIKEMYRQIYKKLCRSVECHFPELIM